MTTTPKIVDIHTAAPSVLVVVLETEQSESGQGTVPDTLDLGLAHWQVNGQPPVAIHRYSMPFDEGKPQIATQPNTYPVVVHHRVYLHLAAPLQEGNSYVATGPYGSCALVFGSRTTFCESLKNNQVGYSDRATSRFAVFGVYLGDGGSLRMNPFPHYDVIDEKTGAVVFSGTASKEIDDTVIGGPTSGEWVYRLPLDAVPAGGPYFLSVSGCGRSRSFGIGGEYTRKAAYVATRGLYHQRCGIALEQPYTEYTRGICHPLIADTKTPIDSNFAVSSYGITPPAGMPTRPMKGSWHDAGNFQRRAQHITIPIQMLTCFEAWPSHFTDRQFNIPESGNGVPDFLDEAMWGVLLWENLQIDNQADPQYGGVQSGTMEAAGDSYGVTSAASSSKVEGTFQVTEWVTAFAAGLFAHASRVIRPFDATRADALLSRARRAWAYLQRTANVNTVATRFMYPALQLYLATGEQPFHDLFKADAQAIVVSGGSWPEQFIPGNSVASCLTVHFVSYLLSTKLAVDATLVAALKAKIIAGADGGGYTGVNTEASAYPHGARAFLGWGATTAQGRYADVYMFAYLFQTDAAKRQQYLNTISALADYSLGLNPLNMSFYTGLGTDSPRSPAHMDSYWTKYGLSDGVTSDHVGKPIGNAPGILIYGAADGPSGQLYQVAVSGKLFPEWGKQPVLRRYGDAWSLINGSEFTVFETMAWNIDMLGFLHDASKDPVPAPPPPPPPPPQSSTSVQLTAAQLDSLKRVVAVKSDLDVLAGVVAGNTKA